MILTRLLQEDLTRLLQEDYANLAKPLSLRGGAEVGIYQNPNLTFWAPELGLERLHVALFEDVRLVGQQGDAWPGGRHLREGHGGVAAGEEDLAAGAAEEVRGVALRADRHPGVLPDRAEDAGGRRAAWRGLPCFNSRNTTRGGGGVLFAGSQSTYSFFH